MEQTIKNRWAQVFEQMGLNDGTKKAIEELWDAIAAIPAPAEPIVLMAASGVKLTDIEIGLAEEIPEGAFDAFDAGVPIIVKDDKGNTLLVDGYDKDKDGFYAGFYDDGGQRERVPVHSGA